VNGPDPLISLKKGSALSSSLKMKWLRAAREFSRREFDLLDEASL
jgi:hypothetical protein